MSIDELTIAVGKSISDIRISKNLTINFLAKSSGLDLNTLEEIESGKTITTLLDLNCIAVALGVETKDFFMS